MASGGEQRAGAEPAQAVQEGARAHPPDDDGEDQDTAEEACRCPRTSSHAHRPPSV